MSAMESAQPADDTQTFKLLSTLSVSALLRFSLRVAMDEVLDTMRYVQVPRGQNKK